MPLQAGKTDNICSIAPISRRHCCAFEMTMDAGGVGGAVRQHLRGNSGSSISGIKGDATLYGKLWGIKLTSGAWRVRHS